MMSINVPVEVFKVLKEEADSKGISVRSLIIRLLREHTATPKKDNA